MKKIYPTIQLFCYFFLILGCSPKDDKVPDYDTCDFLVPECDPVSFTPDENGVLPITETTCLEDIGTMNLLGDSKKYLWFNCSSVNSLLYEDSLGNQIILNIISKIHKLTNSYAYSFSKPGCSEFISASVDEVMQITFGNPQINIKFRLDLAPGGTSPENYDGLRVNKTTFDDQRPFWTNEVLFMYLNNRTPNLTIGRFRHNTHLSIQGKSFNDVYWNDGHYDVPMEIYYNQECGIIAFRDDQGTLWKIVGFN